MKIKEIKKVTLSFWDINRYVDYLVVTLALEKPSSDELDIENMFFLWMRLLKMLLNYYLLNKINIY